MTISTRLFNEQTIRAIGGLNERVAALQEQVSTGKTDLRPSQDLIAAARRSASDEMLVRIDRYKTNIDAARGRLDLADTAMAQVGNATTRLQELSIMAANGTLGQADRGAIRAEVAELRSLLLGLANTRDGQGQALFGGYRTDIDPFVADASGRVGYHGDSGTHVLRVSDARQMQTGLDGQTAFLRIQTDDGPVALFDMIDRFDAALAEADDPDAAAAERSAMVSQFAAATNHVALQRGRIGALGAAAEAHAQVLESRELLVRKSLSGLEDADMAEVVTQLQGLLTNRDATQQVFAKIGQQSLFDFIR